jgi:hypothetical protein
MITVLTTNGLIEIPDEYRRVDSLQPGQKCDIERLGCGEYRVRFSDSDGTSERNWVEWLLECPEKGWFVEPDRSEMTSLEPPRTFAE